MRFVRLGIHAFALTALLACSKIPDTIAIGVAQPLSGPMADLGRDMLYGAELAVNEINAAGIRMGGKSVRLQIISADDQSSPEIGERAAHKLVEQGVVAVVGHLNSGVSIQAAPVYAEKNIPQLAISTQPVYTELGLPTTLRLVASDNIQARAMGSYAATMINTGSADGYAVVDDSSSFGKSLAELAERSLKERGRRVMFRRSLDAKTTDFGALVAELKGSSVKVIITTLADFQVLALVDQLASAGRKDIKIIGADPIKTGKLLSRALPLEVFATSPVLEPTQFYGGRKFVEAFRAAYGSGPVYASHYAYDAIYMISAALRRGDSVDGKALTRALRELEFVAPVTSTMKFGPDGEQVYGSVGIYRPRNGEWEPLVNSDRW